MKKLQKNILLAYSVGSIGTGIFSTVPSILLLYYMTNILGIPVQLAALGIFIPKIWDMITDPLVGYISDKTISRWGRRRPYLFVGSWLMPVCFMLIFTVPDFEDPLHSFFYVLSTFILSATTYTIFAVPYMAMPSEMSNDPLQRTRIVSYRMTFAMIGILLGAAMAPTMVEYFGGGKSGYIYMAGILGLICFICMQVTSLFAKDIPLIEQKHKSVALSRQIALAFNNKPFVILQVTYLFQLIGIGVFTSMVPFFVIHVLQQGQGHVGLLFLISLGMSTLSIPVWGMISNRYGKTFGYYLAVFIYAVSLAGLSLSTSFTYGPELVMLLLGFGFAGLQVLPYSLLTDVIHYDTKLTGSSREGILTGIWTACEKTGLAFGPLVAGILLAWFGFIESSENIKALPQAESTLNGILITVSLVPALFVSISTIFITSFKIPQTQEEPQVQLSVESTLKTIR